MSKVLAIAVHIYIHMPLSIEGLCMSLVFLGLGMIPHKTWGGVDIDMYTFMQRYSRHTVRERERERERLSIIALTRLGHEPTSSTQPVSDLPIFPSRIRLLCVR